MWILIKKNLENHTAIMMAVIMDNKEIVLKLLEKEVDLSIKTIEGDTILMYAARGANIGILYALLCSPEVMESINISNERGETALHFAIQVKSLDAVKLLIDSGADPYCLNEQKENLFQFARKYDPQSIMAYLIENYPDLRSL